MSQRSCHSEKQELVDLCFQIALTLSTPGKGRNGQDYDMTKWPTPKKAEWVARQLALCGFPTTAVGASWGVLEPAMEGRDD